MGAGLDGIIFDDLDCPPTRVSRSLYNYKSCALSHGDISNDLEVEYLKNGVFQGQSY